MADVPTEIRIEHLQNTGLDSYSGYSYISVLKS
jgi:hypothetical protein